MANRRHFPKIDDDRDAGEGDYASPIMDRAGKPDRTFIEAPVMLKAAKGGVKGIACDVSENGIKIMTDRPPELGPVSVKLVGLPAVRGEVRWRTARRVGVHLINPLAPDVLADWIKYHGSSR